MTEALQKRSFLFTGCFLVVLLFTICEGHRNRNDVVHVAHKARYQTRSAFCLNMEPNSGMDDTVVMRFDRKTKKCYRVGERGPCGEMMVFTMEDANYGVCDCDQSLRCGRPLIYWPSKNRCYYAYDQGPCREGKWLVFGFDLHPVCRRNPCFSEGVKQPSYDNRYWFNHKGKCYRTYTQGYCAQNEFLFSKRTHFRPTCVQDAECSFGRSRYEVQSLVCLPGQRMDFLGQCEREYKPLKPVDNTTDLNIIVTPRPSNLYCLFCKN
ncbi:unnamed protein product [Orchesella dallaii]|uniref:DUF4789 domain-containing protein n=1 Tax=Orchesella dallaii TaxID=48710 RepID=A0ABP1QYH5_9HEXA